MFIPTPLKVALEDSVSSGNFIDTKFWVFSRRNRETGRLEQPRAVFVNSAIVRSIPRLGARRFPALHHVGARLTVPDSILDSVPECPLDAGFPQTTEEPLLENHEYESDTDLYDKAQSVSPTSPLSSEKAQIPGGHGLS